MPAYGIEKNNTLSTSETKEFSNHKLLQVIWHRFGQGHKNAFKNRIKTDASVGMWKSLFPLIKL